MKLVYTHENKILVDNAKNLLSLNAIESTMRNQFSAGAIGDLAPIEAWPELWVLRDSDVAKTKELLATLSTDSEALEWVCKHCRETNEASFESCWSCQADRD